MQGCCVGLSVVIGGNWVIPSTGYAFAPVHYQAEMRLAPLACFSACMLGSCRTCIFFLVRRDYWDVARSIHVCRCCHQSGGSGVVDLPDVLLLDGQYLDMFDSESNVSGDLSDDELVEVP